MDTGGNDDQITDEENAMDLGMSKQMASSLMLLLLLKTFCCSYDFLKGMDTADAANDDQTTATENDMDVDTSK